MFESIIQIARESTYDFKKTTCEKDKLNYLFEDWIDYYKTKWAISKYLAPNSILEVGVRYGYSAAAFLDATPSAEFVGIDLDTDLYGGEKGAIEWARKITAHAKTQFHIVDSQSMSRFPGGFYDLIHVDGQQDGDSSLHDLELAVKQARYILVDGYFWIRQNFLATNEFLYRYKDAIEFYGVIPGYAGDLLIKIKDSFLNAVTSSSINKQNLSSVLLKEAYTEHYYLRDCGGFDTYKKTKGKLIKDPRLEIMANLSLLRPAGAVLDLGCGRGELSYYFAKRGQEVTAIDYSEHAIALARNCFDGESELLSKVDLRCADVCTMTLSKKYDLVTAGDLIEHLAPNEVEILYANIAKHLASNGLFIVHTFPNKWFYDYEYKKKRRIAKSVGTFLPVEPRTHYELLMHINEQSPRILQKQLKRHFPHVLLWFAELHNPAGTLLQSSIAAMRSAPSLFVLASHELIEIEKVKNIFSMYPLPEFSSKDVSIKINVIHENIISAKNFSVNVMLSNYTGYLLNSYQPNPVHLSYRWVDEQDKEDVVVENIRTRLNINLLSNSVCSYEMVIAAPPKAGCYTLKITLVQELVRWMDLQVDPIVEEIKVHVV